MRKYPEVEKVLAAEDDGLNITFTNGPDYEAAIALLEKLSDEQLATSKVAIELLKKHGLTGPLQDIKAMSQDEWDDFVGFNLDAE